MKFSTREIRAILVVLALLVFVVVIVAEAIRFDASPDRTDVLPTVNKECNVVADVGPVLSEFDPNTVTYEELRLLGLEPKVAVSLVKYRAAGKVFSIPEDVATCYGITDSIYAVLKPHIVIGNQYKLKHSYGSQSAEYGNNGHSEHRHKTSDNAGTIMKIPAGGFDPNELDTEGFVALGFSEAQSRSIINFRNALGRFRSPEEFARAYAVTPQIFEQLRPYIIINTDAADGPSDVSLPQRHTSLVELNTADSATLVSVRGIGPKTAAAILSYRKHLGGFATADQILETGIVSEQNWSLIREQIYADSCKIYKIDINFAPPDAMAGHPYIVARLLRRILHNRQLKGGWNRIEDMIDDNTLTADDARRLGAYLQFNAISDN